MSETEPSVPVKSERDDETAENADTATSKIERVTTALEEQEDHIKELQDALGAES